MDFATRANLAENSAFVRRVKQALVRGAVAVRSEEIGEPTFSARQKLAIAILQSPDAEAKRFAQGVASSSGITSEDPPDNDIEFTINSLFDPYSGYIERPPAPEPEEPDEPEDPEGEQ